MSKGILGIGDSFMWGESLYFYSDLPNLPFSELHNFDFDSMTEGMVAYKNKYRFIQLVADYYDTWCTVRALNGSTNEYNLEFIDTFNYTDVIKPNGIHHYLFNLDINEYKVVIFLFTSHLRSRDNKIIIDDILTSADKVFSKFEENGIKVCTLCWMPEFFDTPKYRKLYVNKHRHVPLFYKDKQYDWYEDMVQDDTLNLSVKSDFKHKKLQMNDIHFNKKGNQMMADSIIKKLGKDFFKINE
jgi:hypothetical protein